MPTIKNRGNRGVIALLTILGVGFLALGSALAMTSGVLLNLVTGHNMVFGNQSVYTAEAAATEGAYQHENLVSYMSGSPSLINNTSAGSITITDLPSYRFESKSIVSNPRTERHVIKTYTTCPSCEAFTYGFYSGGDLVFQGNATVNGNIYANSLDINGSSQINGNAYAVVAPISGTNRVTGVSVAPVTSPIPSPQADYAALKSASTVFTDDHPTPPPCNGNCKAEKKAQDYIDVNLNSNAIVYIETPLDVSINVAGTFTGTIITAPPTGYTPGNLTINGTFTAPAHYPAIVTQGTLKMAGGTNINGIVFVQGDVNNSGSSNTVNGGIIFTNSGSSSKIKGNIIINYISTYFQDLENFNGLIIPSGSNAIKLLNWREE